MRRYILCPASVICYVCGRRTSFQRVFGGVVEAKLWRGFHFSRDFDFLSGKWNLEAFCEGGPNLGSRRDDFRKRLLSFEREFWKMLKRGERKV